MRESGLKGLSTKSILPYAANAGIAMVMFHTYTTTRLMLHSWADSYPSLAPLAEMPLCCEALAGASAGLMQATLHSPLYNVRLCRDDEILNWETYIIVFFMLFSFGCMKRTLEFQSLTPILGSMFENILHLRRRLKMNTS